MTIATAQQVVVQLPWRSPYPHSSKARIRLQVCGGCTSGEQVVVGATVGSAEAGQQVVAQLSRIAGEISQSPPRRKFSHVVVGATSGPQAPWPGVTCDTVGTRCRSRAARGRQRERPRLDGDLRIGVRKGGATKSAAPDGCRRCMLKLRSHHGPPAQGALCWPPSKQPGVGGGVVV